MMIKKWKEAVVTYSEYCPDICLEGLRKTAKTAVRIEGVPVET
jgi:hypothetical protein